MKYTVKQLRQLANMTQEQMAKYLGISVNTMYNYEKKPKSIPAICALKMADKVNVNVRDIFFEQ